MFYLAKARTVPSTQLSHISPMKKSHFSRKHLDYLRICVFIGYRRQQACLGFPQVKYFSHWAYCSPSPPPWGNLCSGLTIPQPRSLHGSPLLLKSSTNSLTLVVKASDLHWPSPPDSSFMCFHKCSRLHCNDIAQCFADFPLKPPWLHSFLHDVSPVWDNLPNKTMFKRNLESYKWFSSMLKSLRAFKT